MNTIVDLGPNSEVGQFRGKPRRPPRHPGALCIRRRYKICVQQDLRALRSLAVPGSTAPGPAMPQTPTAFLT